MVSSEDIDHSYEDESTPVPTKKPVQAPQVKEKIDYSKRCNNVSIKYLRSEGNLISVLNREIFLLNENVIITFHCLL